MGKKITLFSPRDIETVVKEIIRRQDMEGLWKKEDGTYIELSDLAEPIMINKDWVEVGMKLLSEELLRRFEIETNQDNLSYYSNDTPRLTK